MTTNKIISIIISITAFIVIPVQMITTFVLGILVSLTFGLLLIPFSIIWVVLFLGPLLGLSYVYERVAISRPFIAIIGIPLAVVGDTYVSLLPSMGEMDSRYSKIICCQTFPYTWRYFQYNNYKLNIDQDDILNKIFQEVSSAEPLRKYLDDLNQRIQEKKDKTEVRGADFYFFKGEEHGIKGELSEAISYYKKALQIEPDYASAYYNLGIAYGSLGLYKDAVEVCKQTIRIDPDFTMAYYILGNAYDSLGLYKEAIEAYKQVIRIDPNNANAYYNLGINYDSLGLYKESVEACKQTIRIDPNLVNAYNNLGSAYDHLGLYKEAIEAFKQAIRINPGSAMAYSNLGIAYKRLGLYKEAIEAYKQVIRIDPNHTNTHLSLGLSYFKIGDKSSALNEYEILKKLNIILANQLFDLINN